MTLYDYRGFSHYLPEIKNPILTHECPCYHTWYQFLIQVLHSISLLEVWCFCLLIYWPNSSRANRERLQKIFYNLCIQHRSLTFYRIFSLTTLLNKSADCTWKVSFHLFQVFRKRKAYVWPYANNKRVARFLSKVMRILVSLYPV